MNDSRMEDKDLEAFTPTSLRALADFYVGKRIGGGMSRTVYELRSRPQYVIKIETGRGHFQNIIENEVWQAVKETEFAKWFAPVYSMSEDGLVLVQHRTRLAPASKYPDRMPAFFCDFKYGNYGLYRGRLVCHDYGLAATVMTTGLTKRMQKVTWGINTGS